MQHMRNGILLQSVCRAYNESARICKLVLLSKALQVFCSLRTSSLSEPLNNLTTLGPEFKGTNQHQVMNTSHQHLDRLKGYLKIPSVPYFNLNEASHQCTSIGCYKDLFTVGHFVIPKLHHTQRKNKLLIEKPNIYIICSSVT